MSKSVIVYVDYQNMYSDVRDAFYSETHFHTYGQFNPREFAELLVTRRPFGKEKESRHLQEVRIYTGIPDPRKDPTSHAARERQTEAWKADGVKVFGRALRYPYGWPKEPAVEKGVDVALAVDVVRHAVEGKYDIGIVASTDGDLKPALEYVATRGKNVVCEVVCWWGNITKQLSIEGHQIWCHRLLLADCEAVSDHRDYNLAS
jgi:uncharacterized LabA/DUF88 family protein